MEDAHESAAKGIQLAGGGVEAEAVPRGGGDARGVGTGPGLGDGIEDVEVVEVRCERGQEG